MLYVAAIIILILLFIPRHKTAVVVPDKIEPSNANEPVVAAAQVIKPSGIVSEEKVHLFK